MHTTHLYLPIKSFEVFDDADLPSNSDVVLVLSQYLEALELWRSSHLILIDRSWYWDTKESGQIPSHSPDKNYRAGRIQ